MKIQNDLKNNESMDVIIKDFIAQLRGLNDDDLIINSYENVNNGSHIEDTNNISIYLGSHYQNGDRHTSSSSTTLLKINPSEINKSTSYGSLGNFEIFTANLGEFKRKFSISSTENEVINGKKINTFINIKSDLTNEEDFANWNEIKDEWKRRRKEYNRKLGDELIGKIDIATNGKSTILYDLVTEAKFELVDLDKRITHLQWQYENGGSLDRNLLDEKKRLIDIRKTKLTELPNLINNKMEELGISGNYIDMNKSLYLYGLRQLGIPEYFSYSRGFYDEWVKKNITDVVMKNKITTEKLTKDLEEILGINKAEIEAINKKIENAKNNEKIAKNNYELIRISEEDLILAREYDNIIAQISNKENELLTSNERLEYLKNNLTLNDFREGENAIAIGNFSLASGKDSIAIGKNSLSLKEASISIGSENLVSGNNSIAIGIGNNITDENSISIGQENSINGNKNISIGYKNKTIGNSNSIIGDPNFAYGENIHIIGNDNEVGNENNNLENVFILGSNIINENINNSIILGNNSKAVENSLSIGSENNLRKISFLNDGKISENSNEAINGSQIFKILNGDNLNINKEKWKKLLEIENTKTNIGNIEIHKEEFVNNSIDGNNIITLKGYKIYKLNKPTRKIDVEIQGEINENEKNEIINLIKENNEFLTEVNSIFKISDDKKNLQINVDDKMIAEMPIINLINSNEKEIAYNDKIFLPNNKSVKITNLEDAIINENSTDAVNGRILYNEIDKINKNFIKKDLSNINNENINNLITKLSEGSNFDNPSGKLITDNFLKNILTEKLNSDNLTNNIKKGNIISKTLKITNGNNRILGNEDLKIELSDNILNSLKNNIDGIKTVEYDNINKDKITLGNEDNPVNIKNVTNPIDDLDAVNKKYVDIKVKEVNSNVSNAIAMSQIPQVNSNKLFSIGAGLSYSEKTASVALGISGQNRSKNFIYKLSTSLSSNLKFAIGLGLNYSFVDIKEDENKFNSNEIKNKYNLLKDKYDNLNKEIQTLKDKIDYLNINKTIIETKDIKNFSLSHFKFDEYSLTNEQKLILNKILENLTKDNIIEIIGYTDTTGNQKYNLNLGLKRANEVMKYLISKKEYLNIKISSLGFNKIINSDDDALRRVEIIVK